MSGYNCHSNCGAIKKRASSNIASCIHAWAQQNTAHGDCGNVRFDGQRLFSYWAEVGRFYPAAAKNGARVVVLSRKQFSSTTSAHQSAARSATTQYFQVETENWTNDLPIDWKATRRILLTEHLEKLKAECEALKAKHNVQDQVNRIARQAEKTLEFYKQCFKRSEFPKRSPFTLTGLRILARVGIISEAKQLSYLEKRFAPKLAEKLAKQKARDDGKEKQRRRAKELKAAKEAAQLEEWRKGGPSCYFYNSPIALRTRATTNEIETSRGARVNLASALRLYEIIRDNPSALPGFQIDNFTVRDLIGSNGDRVLRTGCHDIPMSEVERIYRELQQ